MKQVKSSAPVVVSNADTKEFAALGAELGAAHFEASESIREAFVSAMSAASDRTEIKYCRAAFCEAYAKARQCSDKAAQNQWAVLMRLYGFVTPKADTPAARRMAARRAAKKAADAVNPAGKADDATDTPDAPVTGVDAAKRVSMVLDPNEAHLLALIRGAKFASAQEFIKQLAESAAMF